LFNKSLIIIISPAATVTVTVTVYLFYQHITGSISGTHHSDRGATTVLQESNILDGECSRSSSVITY
jgi:hypothetical protein